MHMGLFDRLFSSKKKARQAEKYKIGMKKTREGALSSLKDVLRGANEIDASLYDSLEEIFIMADIGVDVVLEFIDKIKDTVAKRRITDPEELENVIVDEMFELYLQDEIVDAGVSYNEDGLTVILFVGVNGTGKTTSIGKLAHMIKNDGKTVMMAAGDTFRAGAVNQLNIWGDRVGCDVVSDIDSNDPSSVIFDAIRRAKATDTDVLLVDTAGRLQNKKNLMNELGKINRIIKRELDGAPFETYLVVDATTGQNGLQQARIFSEVTDITGIVLTKLDGTAKGGIVLAIRHELNIPIAYVGLGEGIDDLEPFDIEDYIYGLFADLFRR
jgi:fused signal recognition particle receptor